MGEINRQISMDNEHDNEIISNLDLMIMNLEKQQREQNKRIQ